MPVLYGLLPKATKPPILARDRGGKGLGAKAHCVVFVCSLAMAPSSWTASVTVSDTSAVLPGVARSTTALLVDAGLTLHHTGRGKFVVQAAKIHCDQRSNQAVDPASPKSGLPSARCRLNAENLQDTKTGQLFGDALVMLDLLQKIQGSSASGGTQFIDCASGGYCGTYTKFIRLLRT